MIEMVLSPLTSGHIFGSTVQAASQRFVNTWPWYMTRAAGFVAAGLLILMMLSGIGQVTGLTYRFIEPVKAWALHKAIAFALCASIVLHVGFLLIDKFLPFTLSQILIPFVSTYNNKVPLAGIAIGGIAVACGILAMYGIALLVLSSLGWIDTKKGLWRKLHYVSYAVAVLAFIHALGAGTDLRYGTFRAAFIAAGVVVIIGIISRLWRAGTLRKNSEG